MLYEPARHEPLTTSPWDAARARAFIEAVAADAADRFDPIALWPHHPLDTEDPPPFPFTSLYFGASGVAWSLRHLATRGFAAPSGIDATALHAAHVAHPDTGELVPSYYLGEVGVLLLAYRAAPSPELADRLFAVIRVNIPNPTNEALWAAPGTMVAALFLYEWTGDPRWSALFLDNVEHVWSLWHAAAEGFVWTQDLYGEVRVLLGAGHGLAGNAYALLRGAALLPEARRATLYARVADVVTRTARVEDGRCNWAPQIGVPRKGRGAMLVQWCHGAPGMITALADLPVGVDPGFDRALSQGGELVWDAGPLTKGPGLCHGTAGNGYALLRLFQRTGDARWLDRARQFAMHTVEQSERMRVAHGQRRYSLWTGDPGAAVYVADCIAGAGGLPGLDVV